MGEDRLRSFRMSSQTFFCAPVRSNGRLAVSFLARAPLPVTFAVGFFKILARRERSEI